MGWLENVFAGIMYYHSDQQQLHLLTIFSNPKYLSKVYNKLFLNVISAHKEGSCPNKP